MGWMFGSGFFLVFLVWVFFCSLVVILVSFFLDHDGPSSLSLWILCYTRPQFIMFRAANLLNFTTFYLFDFCCLTAKMLCVC